MSEETDLIVFETEGAPVTFDSGVRMWNLTQMHQASGGKPNKAPAQWLRSTQARELLIALDCREPAQGDASTDPEARFLDTRRGNAGGTYAHWQIATVYAHYLNPDFYLQWNEWAMQRITGAAQPAGTLAGRIAAQQLVRRTITTTTVEEYAPMHPQAAAILAILEHAGSPLPSGAIIELLKAAGITVANAHQVRVRLRRMARRGQVCRVARGTWTKIA